MNAAVLSERRKAGRPQLIAWVALISAVALSAVLMSLASTTTREARRAVGNGVGRYIHVSATTDTAIATVSWLSLAAGTGAWALLLGRSSRPAGRMAAAIAGGIVVVTGYLWVASPLLAGDGFSDSERYESVSAVVDALRSSGMPCAETAAAPAAATTQFFADSRTCRQPNPADIRDGHDEVVVSIFAGGGMRDRWTSEIDHDEVHAVIGPRWVATCDFQATCARMQALIGGRNY